MPADTSNLFQPRGRTIPTCEVFKEGQGRIIINQSDLATYTQNGFKLVEGSAKAVDEVTSFEGEDDEKLPDAPGHNTNGSGGSGVG